jgi:hypothetical protein
MAGSKAFEEAAVMLRLIKAVNPEAPLPAQLIQLEHEANAVLGHYPQENHRCIVVMAGQIAREMLLAHKMSEKYATRRAVDLMLALGGSE